MDAYDNHVVKLKGKRTKKSELNRPEQWGWLFENADDSDGGIAEERNDSRVPSPPTELPPSKRQKIAIPSIYENVSYSKRDKKYLAQVVCDRKLHCLGEFFPILKSLPQQPFSCSDLTISFSIDCIGYYKYAADAALAADKGAILGTSGKLNFSTRQQYRDAIKKETEAENENDSVDVEESYNAVLEKVEVYLSKIYAADVKKDSDEEMSTGFDSSASNQDADIENQTYAGVAYHKKSKKYKAQIYILKSVKKDLPSKKRLFYLGMYALQTDAALAHDEAARLLKLPVKSNFVTLRDYEQAKLRELGQTGVGGDAAMSSEAIESKVTKVLSKHLPSSAVSKRKSSSNFTGVAYVKSKRTYLAKLMHNRKPHLRKY